MIYSGYSWMQLQLNDTWKLIDIWFLPMTVLQVHINMYSTTQIQHRTHMCTNMFTHITSSDIYYMCATLQNLLITCATLENLLITHACYSHTSVDIWLHNAFMMANLHTYVPAFIHVVAISGLYSSVQFVTYSPATNNPLCLSI